MKKQNAKLSLKIFAMLALLMLPFFVFAAKLNKNSWDIDKFMKFQIAYIPGDAYSYSINCKSVACNYQKPLYKPSYDPDITNINLADILHLGFDIENPRKNKNPSNYNLYLKLYPFPSELDNTETINQFIDRYKSDLFPDAQYLKTYVFQKKNIIIKFAEIDKKNTVFTRDHHMERFLVTDTPGYAVYFNNHIPFYSLYLVTKGAKPHFSSNEDKANFSTQGVSAFYRELLNSYRHNLQELKGVDKKYYYFTDVKNLDKTRKLVLLILPKQPLEFKNWRDLPMPQDPNNIFLTSLLLIYHTEYNLKSGALPTKIPQIDSPNFKKLFVKNNTKVLEIASVVYLDR